MNNLFARQVVNLLGAASVFVILFGIRASSNIINPILLAVPLTIVVLIMVEYLEGMNTLAVLMRNTGETDKEEHRQAMVLAQGL